MPITDKREYGHCPNLPTTSEYPSNHKRQAQANSHRREVLSPVCQRTGDNLLWFSPIQKYFLGDEYETIFDAGTGELYWSW